MATPGSPQVIAVPFVIQSGHLLSIDLRRVGSAGAATLKQLMDEVVQRVHPGGWPPEAGDDAVEKGYVLSGQEAEHRMRHLSMGQHAPATYHSEQQLTQGQPTHDTTDVDMTNPPEFNYRESGPQDQTTLPPEGANTQLESEIRALKTANEDLTELLKQANYEKDELVLKLNRANQERDDLLRQKQVNQLKIRKLNDMIIKNSSKSDEPIDEDILQDMFRIRNLTTEIIKTHFAGEAKFQPEKARRLEEYYARFYDQRVRKNFPEGRRRLLISAVFEELQQLFFGPNAKRFGVPRDTERELQQFERQIETSNKVETEEALEWRTRTVSYAGRLNLNTADMVNKCTHHLEALLSPMVLPGKDRNGNPDPKEVERLSNALFELCSAALKLALRFRSSKTKYEFKAYPNDTCQAACDPDLIRPMDTEGPVSKPADPNKRLIFCTLFGALVKTRPSVSGEPGERAVLEKGHVILYEPRLWG